MVWCSSGILFGFYCDDVLWLGKVKYVPFTLIVAHLEAGNHHHQVLQLEPLKVWKHGVIGVGSGVYGVATCTT